MQETYPKQNFGPPGRKDIAVAANIPGGISDSTFLGVAASGVSGSGVVVRKFNMPFSRIHAVYFISPELCCDPIGEATLESVLGLKSLYGNEREIICDFSSLESTIPALTFL